MTRDVVAGCHNSAETFSCSVIPAQQWVELVGQHGYPQGFLHFWAADYFRFGALDGIILPMWQHLWFVVYLWVYTMLVVLLLAVIPAVMRAMLAEAVFPFHIIHQTIIVVVGWHLLRADVAALPSFLILLAATMIGCWLFYAIGRSIGWLRPLIGLQRR